MTNYKNILIVINFLGFIGLTGIAEAFPFGIFPLLTTGWYYKPSPSEQVVLGLIVVKVLALRLASITGILPIPYHLNDIFLRSLGKRSLGGFDAKFNNSTENISFHLANEKVNITKQEFAIVERILLSLRRTDPEDCFVRVICELNQDLISDLMKERRLLIILPSFNCWIKNRLRQNAGIEYSKNSYIWDTYEDAVKLEPRNCTKKYSRCPLSRNELEFDALFSN